MTSFLTELAAIDDDDREGLLAVVADRFEAVSRAQALVGERVSNQTETLAESQREFDALLDAIRSDLADAGADPSALSRTELIEAANEGRVSDEIQERIAETLPRLRESAAAGQQASSNADDLLAEITAESHLYERVVDLAERGAPADELRAAIVAFVEEDSVYGPEEGTAVDGVLADHDPERDP